MGSISSKISVTIITGIGWLAFIIMFLAFYAGGFDFFQNIAVIIVSALIALAIVALTWIHMISG